MPEILVLGAGVVGVSTALAFQALGHDVTIVDRRPPGQETSFGNAGIIQSEAAEPYALPRDFRTLFHIATRQSNDVHWTLPGLLRMAPALCAYFLQSAQHRHAEISLIYAQLTAQASQDHAPLIEAAGLQNLIAKEGLSILFRDAQSFDAAASDAERLTRSYGVQHRAIGGDAYRKEEPALLRAPEGVIHWTQSWSCAAPGDLVAGYAALFQRRGGRILIGDGGSLTQTGAGWCVQTAEGDIEGEDAIVALGPWSPEVLRRFGYRIPMIYKRGYHAHYEAPMPIRRPFLDAAHGIVASSMTQGVRLLTGASLVAKNAPPDLRQLERGRNAMGDFLQLGARKEEPQWSGARPCLPDMLPLVGASPKHKGLWFNFGHGHQGFTLGPTTARLLVEAHSGRFDNVLQAISPLGRI